VRSEFRQIVESQTIGLSVGEATERFADRMPIPEASFFSIVVNITQKSGGNLSESLGNLSTVLSSTLRILSGEAEGFGESIPKFDGNFHAVWALPGHG
jgi:Flp pilus assembly protein TadB